MDYQAEMDRILAEYRSAARGVREEFFEADERTTRGGAALFEDLRKELEQQPEPPEQPADDERDRLLREAAERSRTAAAERRTGTERSRDGYVLPSDWTDADEARMEGYGPPDSWLR
ncbi:hypothetical protein [Nocardia blacklockiae]|uniref:hypothetical protein n=1 Tax=Nocardia blacklockiae TaxID=480036 RepID=UPI001894C1A4|nr:hypothetical protein [Nocardia blacklockiae]MBF6172619.1 hypothetical protein [Nocardia blacklockiae]